jgi:hypothetical protein
VEFVPKTDSQVQRLLASREDIFPHYTLDHFTGACSDVFEILDSTPIRESERTMLLLQRK